MVEDRTVVPNLVSMLVLLFEGINDLVVGEDFFVLFIVGDNTKAS